jgi:hypothetical protein
LQRALDSENQAKKSRGFTRTSDKPRNDRHNVNMVEYGSKSSDDEDADVCVAEWDWASKSKPFVCCGWKLVSKNRQDDMRFTFDVAKCDRIFYYLLQEKQIKWSSNHVIPPLEQLKKHTYCKWHSSYSYTTNDCNAFRRQVQSTINEGRLKFAESPQMKLDKDMFPANTNMAELEGKKVMVWPSEAESMKGKDVIIGEDRKPRIIKPKSLEAGQWKRNEKSKPHSCPKATFDILIAKYREGRAGIRLSGNWTT